MVKQKYFLVFGIIAILGIVFPAATLALTSKECETLFKAEISTCVASGKSTEECEKVICGGEPPDFFAACEEFLKEEINACIASSGGSANIEEACKNHVCKAAYNLPKFGPDTLEEIRKHSEVVKVYGKIPSFDNNIQRQRWLTKLRKLSNNVKGYLPRLHPEGPIVSYGVNINGFFFVDFEQGAQFDEDMMNETYAIIDEKAKELGIEEVPVVFRVSSVPLLESEKSDSEKHGIMTGLIIASAVLLTFILFLKFRKKK